MSDLSSRTCFCGKHNCPECGELARSHMQLIRKTQARIHCVNLGPAHPNQNCGCKQKVRVCDIHQKCTTGVKVDGIACCVECGDFETSSEPGSFIDEFYSAKSKFSKQSYSGGFSGRGIVIPAGGWKLFPGVYVAAKIIRSIGCTLPIEVMYVGDNGEMDPIFPMITSGLGVTWINVSEKLKSAGIKRRERLKGWAVKPLALEFSSFEDVCMIDSDCYPVVNPESIMDSHRYRDTGSLFFPDNPLNKNGRPLTSSQWALFGLQPRSTPGFESGQMFVNKRKAWPAVRLASWMSDWMSHFDNTRGVDGGIYGDKDIFSVAWSATSTPYLMAPPVKWVEVAFVQHDLSGRPAFIHRCQDKPRVYFGGQKQSRKQQFVVRLPHENLFQSYIQELQGIVRPNIPGFRDGTQDDQIWREIGIANTYRLPDRMDGMSVIDVGAHIGLFSLECLRRGAEKVVAIEPYEPNFSLAKMNLASWSGRCSLRQAAVAGCDVVRVGIRPSLNGPSLTGEPHVHPDGALVDALSLDQLIIECSNGGRVNFLKMDCEGSEYPSILASKSLHLVDCISIEWHSVGCDGTPEQLCDKLTAEGFMVEWSGKSDDIGMMYAIRKTTI